LTRPLRRHDLHWGERMNRYGEIADELTELVEELDGPDAPREVRLLKAALQRAFARACEAERMLRLQEQAVPVLARPAPRARRRPGRSEHGQKRGVVIHLSSACRAGGAAARRLDE
jgi:hypothetical protein